MIDSIDSLDNKANRMCHVSSGISKPTVLKGHHVFLNALPWSWTPRPTNEAFLHYDVEILDSGTPRGIAFAVYIVCPTSLRIDSDAICLAMDCDKLKYYTDRASKPVILVVVDTAKESAFWLLIQEYIHGVLAKKTPGWREQKTVSLHIPLNQELTTSLEQLKKAVCYGLELLYMNHFYRFYQKFSSRINQFFNSPEEMELAMKVESSRHYAKQLLTTKDKCSCSSTSGHSCSSCRETDNFNHFTLQSDLKIQASLEKAQNMKVLDPKENRTAYYCISHALDIFGDRASAGVRYTAQGEMVFYDYLLHFLKAFDSMGTQAMVHLTHTDDYRRYFKAIEELTDIINRALEEGELIAASVLTIRLADTYLFATPYLIRTFGQEISAPLMDFAQSLLLLAHKMASLVESPDHVIQ
ncbi:DUF4365 domain-containing protein [Desulforamulus putei]|uniref:Uncharacterized protein n=1 Tax=Desulforamulus putei DSM 12395 TaxID=1121429 RepID=A0A1M4SC16_9FIRM|nr:DUF4365 domain-containing protein [Desulforamulus putei]SHE29793.1 protein of unknown function [Desulforamulus putei DSM 12395]